MSLFMKIFTFLAVVCPVSGGSCAQGHDETSLLQLTKAIKKGGKARMHSMPSLSFAKRLSLKRKASQQPFSFLQVGEVEREEEAEESQVYALTGLPQPSLGGSSLQDLGSSLQDLQQFATNQAPTVNPITGAKSGKTGTSPLTETDIAVVAALAADLARDMGMQTTSTTTPVGDVPLPGTTTPFTSTPSEADLGKLIATSTSTPESMPRFKVAHTTTTTPEPAMITTAKPAVIPQVNETMQEQIDENIMQMTSTTTGATRSTLAPAQITAQEEAADAMVDHAAAQLKAFNSERQAAAKVAVWIASQQAAKATDQAAEDEKSSVDKGMKAVKATAKAAKATIASLTQPPNPKLAAAYANNLASVASPAMETPMTKINPDKQPNLAPTVQPPFDARVLPMVSPKQLYAKR